MTNVLVIVSDRGTAYLPACLASAEACLPMEWFHRRIVIDDSGEPNPAWPDNWEIVAHSHRRGLAASVQSAWNAARGCDWLFHLEEDFTFTGPVPVEKMRKTLMRFPHLAQMALLRQPVNEQERAAGGHQQGFEQHTNSVGHHWLEQEELFTLNPCLIPGWVPAKVEAGLEADITRRLCDVNPDVRFGVWGRKDDAPRVLHGGVRSPAWST